jgi:hypothetical protein
LVFDTLTRNFFPTSLDPTINEESVAPFTDVHEHDEARQDSQRNDVLVIALPPSAHDPSTAVSVCPTAAVPLTAVPPELVGAVGADKIVNDLVTVEAVA